MAGFGFSVGDFITVLQLAHKVRHRFVDAPGQFAAISDDVRSLSAVLQEVDLILPKHTLTDQQVRDFESISKGCYNVLSELDTWLSDNDVGSRSHKLREKASNTLKRLRWDSGEMRDFRNRITSNISLLNILYSKLSGARIIAIEENVGHLIHHQEEEDRKSILNWLDPVDFYSQQVDFRRRCQEGTGLWFLNSSEFCQWLNTHGKTMFCFGMPGSGKTILTSLVIDTLNCQFDSDPDVAVAYIFCNHQRQDDQKPVNILANILKQLCERKSTVSKDVEKLYEKYRNYKSTLQTEHIIEAFESTAILYSKIFIIVDALDEQTTSEEDRCATISAIFQLQSKFAVNFFATSRTIPEIEVQFETCIRKEIRATDDDILKYVESRGRSLLRSKISKYPDLQSLIKREIPAAADGMFLLAQLNMDLLMTKATAGSLRQAVQTLPKGAKGLDKTYDLVMERIRAQGEDFQMLAQRALAWVLYSRTPLMTAEIQHAVAISPEMSDLDEEFMPEVEDLISFCHGLLTVDRDRDVVRLIHYTAQEYLESALPQILPDPKTYLATSCLTYLLFDVFGDPSPSADDIPERKKQNVLLDRAANDWGCFARDIENEMHDLVWSLLDHEAKHANFLQALRYEELPGRRWIQSPSRELSAFYYLARWGLAKTLKTFLERGENPKGQDANVNFSLCAAVEWNHIAVVKLLLQEKHADVNYLDSDDHDILPPLHQAILAKSHVIQEFLLQQPDIDVNLKCDIETPLTVAWSANDVTAIGLLLQRHDLDINATLDVYGRTALHYAVVEGKPDILSLLLRHPEIDVNVKDTARFTPLGRAANSGNAGLAQLLLAHKDVDVNQEAFLTSPLTMAALGGFEDVVKVLLTHGDIVVNGAPASYYSALPVAADGGHVGIVKLLLSHKGKGMNMMNENGCRALFRAVDRGHEEIVKILLDHKEVDVNTKNEDACRALFRAVSKGYEGIVSLLLKHEGMDVFIKNRNGCTPLFMAVDNGNEEIVKLLLEHEGIDVNAANAKGRTALSVAVDNGFGLIEQMLLQKGAT
ncbi:ankyrin repeat domain-containing protein [Paracoccidioides lutzii Pb01]|uniref:Ankyrin repeat domain-containing protein n=1 Tax=Paracoccidioides lutzii (strain ATCC MYA-826 / Pb01) TaxID=502779 RepID=C1H514_PARBA|nr:ankyrin repeat domain-containing protein [Paracoccidioides lutzii Pb01]EEH34808.1 ankyrin repeat domain-containing protein [Paracoccidioides lutzii Pb01]